MIIKFIILIIVVGDDYILIMAKILIHMVDMPSAKMVVDMKTEP